MSLWRSSILLLLLSVESLTTKNGRFLDLPTPAAFRTSGDADPISIFAEITSLELDETNEDNHSDPSDDLDPTIKLHLPTYTESDTDEDDTPVQLPPIESPIPPTEAIPPDETPIEHAPATDPQPQEVPPIGTIPEDEPVAETPPEDEPASETPPEDEPAAETPPEDEPVAETPPEDEPVAETPPEDEPAAETPPEDEPAAETPHEDKPASETPPADEPVAETPPADEPAAETPPENEPAAETPPDDEPAAETPLEDEPAAETLPRDEPATETPSAEEPATPESEGSLGTGDVESRTETQEDEAETEAASETTAMETSSASLLETMTETESESLSSEETTQKAKTEAMKASVANRSTASVSLVRATTELPPATFPRPGRVRIRRPWKTEVPADPTRRPEPTTVRAKHGVWHVDDALPRRVSSGLAKECAEVIEGEASAVVLCRELCAAAAWDVRYCATDPRTVRQLVECIMEVELRCWLPADFED